MKQVLCCALALSYLHSSSDAFGLPTSTTGLRVSKTLLALAPIDPATVEMGLVAAVSAAAGVMTQQPRIQELETETLVTKEALNATREEMDTKLTEFEDKLFTIDQEYEAQTAKFKKEYEARMKQDLERAKEKLMVDYQYKLEINTERQKSDLLSRQYLGVSEQSDREAQLSALRLEMRSMLEENRKLKDDLESTAQELEDMKDDSKGKSFLGLFK